MPYNSNKTINELILVDALTLDLANDEVPVWQTSAPVGDRTKRVKLSSLLARTVSLLSNVPWTAIDKTGAVASDIGAATASHIHSNATTSTAGFLSAADKTKLDGLGGVATTSVTGLMSAADKTKLDGIAAGATANSSDALLRDRTTHTGSQAISTVTGLQAALDGKQAYSARLNTISTQANPTSPKNFQLNADGTITLIDPPTVGARPKVEIATSMTISASDVGKHLYYQGTTPITITVPTGLTQFGELEVAQLGTGTVTLSSGSGMLLNGVAANITLNRFTALVVVIYASANAAVYGGNLDTKLDKAAFQQVTASRTLALSDSGFYLSCDSTSAITITVPNDSSVNFPIGSSVEIAQENTGSVTVSGATGVNIRRYNSANTTGHLLAGRYAATVLEKVAANEWRAFGGFA